MENKVKVWLARDEQIKCASKDYVNYLLDKQEYHNEDYTEDDIRQAFEKGAMFADNNPYLSSLWHDASEEPRIGSNIVVVDEDGQWWDIQPYDGEYDGYGDLTGWRCCVVHYNNIQSWAYISDLLPKGGEK